MIPFTVNTIVDVSSYAQSNQYDIAANNNTPPCVLVELSKSNDPKIRMRVASNESTPKEILDYLSSDKDFYVRWFVAYNLNISEYTSHYLMKSDRPEILHALTKNKNLTENALRVFCKINDYGIKVELLKHPKMSRDILGELVANEESRYFLNKIIEHPLCDEGLAMLIKLSL